ncbi:DNA polymerase I [Pseudobacteriovorax antillogorgiicola]|uniref:DNA polymerase I n=1 Tax=Pseudobacteriovorax antillogorgiicola TaxID=1513793 RepID=A0A1Y6C3D2_9BACT|nr:DNA polymerase I [Pseudobacteriovorax antillogorgiicola]TCS50288.1 DNA polymerase I [Pseudobacteriovorax antillogorgiicola]SMF33884.1 DNA polymerase I [Pseudobacteriovorax antillogorgiicola]
MTKRRLFVVDAMALAFRSYHAFQRPLTTSSGLPTQAVYGSLMFLMNLIEKERPDYLVIATDSREKTFRHERFEAYKANRSDMPEDLAIQLPHLFKAFEALGCKLLKEPGLEADDLIGSLVRQVKQDGLESYIVSGDKDFMQLVDDATYLYAPKKGGEFVLYNEAAVIDKYGVRPDQIIDMLALMGDSADNVPGVAGIGEKGAAKLIQKYDSLEGIYENLDDITNKRQKNGLESSRDSAFLSQELVTIKIDAELPYTLDDLCCLPDNALRSDALLELTQELELRTLTKRVQDRREAASSAQEKDLPFVQDQDRDSVDYQLINEPETVQEFLNKLKQQDVFCVDTETTGLDISSDTPIGISISWQAEQAFYIPLNQDQKADLAHLKQELQSVLSNPKVTKVGHNIKFDWQMLHNTGLTLSGPFADTMIASHILHATERSHSLDACCARYLNYKKIPTTDLLGKTGTMVDVPIADLSRYACEDADLCLQLYQHLLPKIKGSSLETIFSDIEMPLIPVIAKMEQAGVYVDRQSLAEQSEELETRSEELKKQIYELAGEEFNIQSPKQLQAILFEKLAIHEELGIKRIKKTKSGYSTDVSVLEKLSAHPLPKALLEFRVVSKLKSTYIDSLPKMISAQSDRLHASFHQTGTATGRLSSSEPNLQNIPIRTPLGRRVREAFRSPEEDWVMVSADYSQIELRVLASLSKDENLKQAFVDDADIHTATAASIFGVDPEDVSHEQRSQAKAINFGIIYGMGPQRLARETGVSTKEAKTFIEKYFARYPHIKGYIDKSISFAKEHEYTETLTGRRRPLPEINSSDRLGLANAQNIAINSPVQGTAADLIKIAMVKIQKKLDDSQLSAKMLMQVHDELVFECPRSELEALQTIIKKSMETAMDIGVPLKVAIGYGTNWLEAH